MLVFLIECEFGLLDELTTRGVLNADTESQLRQSNLSSKKQNSMLLDYLAKDTIEPIHYYKLVELLRHSMQLINDI